MLLYARSDYPPQSSNGPHKAPRPKVRPRTVTISLEPAEAALLDEESLAVGLSRAHWISALIRHRLQGRRCFNRYDRVRLGTILKQLRRMQDQTAKVVHTLSQDGLPPREMMAGVEEARALRGQVADLAEALRKAMLGNDDYWAAADVPAGPSNEG